MTHHFPDGLPNAILVSDRYGAYMNFASKGKQYCLAHLLRDAKYLQDLENTPWATQFIQWIEDSFANRFAPDLADRLDVLLKETLTCGTPKTGSFLKWMQKKKEDLTTFLSNPDVPLDNNASERAIRNIKSKTKIACQFKTEKGACIYANIRSVMDTACKNDGSNWKTFLQIAQNYLQVAT